MDASTFRCLRCKQRVPLDSFGTTQRNHCPFCLSSRHLDHTAGDRKEACGARMDAVAVTLRDDGEWAIIHRCTNCAVLRENRVAGDDNIAVLLALASRPLANPPVPLEFYR